MKSKQSFLKYLIPIILSIVIVTLAGFGLQQFLVNRSKEDSKNVQSREVIQTDSNSPIVNQGIIKKGNFIEIDPIHKAEGEVKIIQEKDKILIQLGSDFKVSYGPDLYLWVVKNQDLKKIALGGVDSTEGSYINLGLFNKLEGSQTFQITKEEYSEFSYAVVIWCKAFGVQFSYAVLK